MTLQVLLVQWLNFNVKNYNTVRLYAKSHLYFCAKMDRKLVPDGKPMPLPYEDNTTRPLSLMRTVSSQLSAETLPISSFLFQFHEV